MKARELLADLENRGVALTVTPQGNIRCKPKTALAPKDVAALRACKRDMVDILRAVEKDTQPSPPSPPSPYRDKPDNHGDSGGDSCGDGYDDYTPQTVTKLDEIRERRLEDARRLGLVARWAHEKGFVAVHDPTTGEWHDLPLKDAPGWARRECFKRKELRKLANITILLSRAEMEEIVGEEAASAAQNQAVSERGLVYRDYLVEDES